MEMVKEGEIDRADELKQKDVEKGRAFLLMQGEV